VREVEDACKRSSHHSSDLDGTDLKPLRKLNQRETRKVILGRCAYDGRFFLSRKILCIRQDFT
jgi:phosphoribosylformimino-5-aminoimidazole carboxamide ribonucleotide (ProFAR) isomerase